MITIAEGIKKRFKKNNGISMAKTASDDLNTRRIRFVLFDQLNEKMNQETIVSGVDTKRLTQKSTNEYTGWLIRLTNERRKRQTDCFNLQIAANSIKTDEDQVEESRW